MKRFWLSVCLFSLGVVLAAGQELALEGTADVYRFEANGEPYIEIFFYILGSTVLQPGESGKTTKPGVEVLYFIEDSNGGVIAGDKYNLFGPSSGKRDDFMDIRRIKLRPGDYILYVEYRDLADSTHYLELSNPVSIPESGPEFSQSDLQLLSECSSTRTENSKFIRNGVFMLPLPFAWYHDAYNRLYVYNELYRSNTFADSDFYISYHIFSFTNPGEPLITAHKRLQPADVNPLLLDIDISVLSSGDYIFRLEVHKRNKDLVSERDVEFRRSNKSGDRRYVETWQKDIHASFVQELTEEQLQYSLRALPPVISSIQNESLNYLVKKGSDKNKRQFLHEVWYEKNPEDPFGAYSAYMDVARWVDETYGAAFGHGFETDRGHIYLKYGQPDDIVSVEDEPSAPPYEIWIYYDFPRTNQSNVKFLFYNPSLAGNAYELLHSTAVGEVRNPRWEVILYSDAPNEISGDNSVDATSMQDNFNRNARRYFNDF